jgi:hypothetical protein
MISAIGEGACFFPPLNKRAALEVRHVQKRRRRDEWKAAVLAVTKSPKLTSKACREKLDALKLAVRLKPREYSSLTFAD